MQRRSDVSSLLNLRMLPLRSAETHLRYTEMLSTVLYYLCCVLKHMYNSAKSL